MLIPTIIEQESSSKEKLILTFDHEQSEEKKYYP